MLVTPASLMDLAISAAELVLASVDHMGRGRSIRNEVTSSDRCRGRVFVKDSLGGKVPVPKISVPSLSTDRECVDRQRESLWEHYRAWSQTLSEEQCYALGVYTLRHLAALRSFIGRGSEHPA